MEHQPLNLDELVKRLGRDRRTVEKLVNRGQIPGRKVGGQWQFHPREITHWLEQEMREYNDSELQKVEESQTASTVDTEVPVSSLLRLETVQVPLEARTKRSVLESLVEVAGRTWNIWSPADVLKAVQEREQVMSTGFDNGVAIPHPRNPVPDALGESVIAFGRTFSGIPFGAPRRKLSDLFFLVLCLDSQTHLHALARLGRMLQLPNFVDQLREAYDNQTAYDVICDADKKIA
ncbi:MAG: PTS fructose transporter subunit IIABC [Planctomycetaceae bacterium]|nr:PTS fructose transporter subunit IIABC [Planctomycetaceae bacterium]